MPFRALQALRPARIALALTLALGLAACAPAPLRADAASAHPASGQWLRTELYFGLGSADGPDPAGEARWRAFLDREVTPRFPDGLSVFDVYGQWRTNAGSGIERLHSKLLLILHDGSAAQRAKLEALREAWKHETGDVSVLRVTQPADVSF